MQPRTILDHIGNTPLVDVSRMSPNPAVQILAKLEWYNPTGSIKDRVAKYLVESAEAKGDLVPGQTMVEASTGNTALALALVGKQKGYGLTVVLPRAAAPGVEALLRTYDVETVLCDPRAGMRGAIELARELEQQGCYNTCQFESDANVLAHYETTGPEILRDAPRVDMFIAGIGTGGTLMGVGRRLREHNPNIQVIGVEPRMGEHLQGLRSLDEGYLPPLLDLSKLDGRFLVDSLTAFQCARDLLDKTGIFAGVSSGAVLHCAQRMAERLDRGTIVVIFADAGWKYLSVGPWKEEMEARMHSPDDTAWW